MLLQSVWGTEFQTYSNISRCAWIPPAVGNLLLSQMAPSFSRHLSLFKCFLFLYQTWFCPFRTYRVIPSLLPDDWLQYLRRPISFLILSIFTAVTLPVHLEVFIWLAGFKFPPILFAPSECRWVWQYLSQWVVSSIEHSTSHKPIISYLTQVKEDNTAFLKKRLESWL